MKLSDEQIQQLRKQVSEESGEWHFDTLAFARKIEKAVLEKVELDTEAMRLRLAEMAAEVERLSATANNPALAAIEYVLKNPMEDPIEFLFAWSDGDFHCIRREWDNVPDEVFIGADVTFKPGGTK